MENKLECRTPNIVEIVEVIHTQALRGQGTEENPIRHVDQYWSKDGELLAENDVYGGNSR